MIVYGDHERPESPRAALADLSGEVLALSGLPPGSLRSARAARVLIAAGELAQGLIDASFHDRGVDAKGRTEILCGRLVKEAARALLRSEKEEVDLGGQGVEAVLARLGRARLPDEIVIKVPEGYAFYAVYPELYLRAAEALKEEAGGRVVALGIRSIGTSLAAAVAAGAGAESPPITLRPVGHPFDRSVTIAPSLEKKIFRGSSDAIFAIADEGPGLSGSSFGSVADWLEDRGVAASRIVFFPSHGGSPGPRASERHRARWQRSRRLMIDFDTLFLCGPRPRLAAMIEAGAGAEVTQIEDVSGGRWREKLYRDPKEWPPACPHRERRKFLVMAGGRSILAKFTGLGRAGDDLFKRAQRLDAGGFIPPVIGLAHGFLLSEWRGDARPLGKQDIVDRGRLVQEVGSYIGFLAKELPAKRPGASPARLFEMARFNTCKTLGPELAAELDRFEPRIADLTRSARYACTDNKLHLWEWLALPDGRLLKADALDHHASHDLIGPQDPAWDIAGASIEISLAEAEQAALIEAIGRASPYRADPLTLVFYTACYLAFQLGYYSMATAIDGGSDEAERARLSAARYRYQSSLTRLLQGLMV
jgi:hypothetical protein